MRVSREPRGEPKGTYRAGEKKESKGWRRSARTWREKSSSFVRKIIGGGASSNDSQEERNKAEVRFSQITGKENLLFLEKNTFSPHMGESATMKENERKALEESAIEKKSPKPAEKRIASRGEGRAEWKRKISSKREP